MLVKYNEWLQKQLESCPTTRNRREIALGLRTPTGMGSINSHSTAIPWEIKNIKKILHKKKSHKRK